VLNLPHVEFVPVRAFPIAHAGDGGAERQQHIPHVERNPEGGAIRNELLDDDEASPKRRLAGRRAAEL
jgi:hypothetical protein